MSINQQMPITLSIVERQVHLTVLGISGWEALNAPYRFVIDLLSTHTDLQPAELEQQTAYLHLSQDHGVHGKIISATRLYAGTSSSLYRIDLGPGLLALQHRSQHRVFRGLSVPQIIARLLNENGLDDTAYRFEPLVGVYPARALCVQQGETDLHLLLRLCEEEGIHLRFEHQPTAHLMIFADDPACFPCKSEPVRFQSPDVPTLHTPTISFLAQRWALQLPSGIRAGHHHEWSPYTTPQSPANQQSANQRFEPSVIARLPTEQQAHDRQISVRALERERCERRSVFGLGAELPLTAGQVMQVQGHPDSGFDDQWLVVEITHAGKQPQALKGRDTDDVAAILEVLDTPTLPARPWPRHTEIPGFSRGYRNSFRVLPWEMPFRAAFKHHKPSLPGFQEATLLSGCNQTREQLMHGRLPIRFEQQSATEEPASELCAPLCLSSTQITALRTGATLLIGHFDNDPDRPIIYALSVEDEVDAPGAQHSLDADGPLSVEDVHVTARQSLHLKARQAIRLETGHGGFDLTCERISLSGTLPALNAGHHCAPPHAPPASPLLFLDTDLRLTEHPGLRGAPLANRLWYIVRMREPGLEFFARLHPEHFLFEGKTDPQGYCGLGPEQLRELAAAYRETPDHLCLIHPGHCIPLQAWFQQNWPTRLHQAFMQHC